MNAIIVHGMPSREEYESSQMIGESNKHWIPWLREKLQAHNIDTFTPEMPKPYEPEYLAWKGQFEKGKINENTILIGHSCGAGFLVRYLSQENKKVGKVILVAPWIDIDKHLKTKMFDFVIDPKLIKKAKGISIFYSTDDDAEIIASSNMLGKKLEGSVTKVFRGKGHFTEEDMGTTRFPELLEEAIEGIYLRH